MTMNEFMQNCSACGGNWGAMLLTGIKRVFPEHYTEVEAHYNSMDFSIGYACYHICIAELQAKLKTM